MRAGPGYVHANTPDAAELARLRLLEQRYDAVTRGRLARWGDLSGAHCLEVGAGAGSVTRMLAEMVGASGHVVALDLDLRFLAELDLANVTTRQHDIVDDELEVDAYDLVHCRALLLHLPDPVRALGRMVAALRPGGVLLVEDADFATMAARPGHPGAQAFDRLARSLLDRKGGSASIDPEFGRRLPTLLTEFGLVDTGSEALEFLRIGGSPEAELFAHGYSLVRDGVLPWDFPRDADLDSVIAALRDPDFTFVDSLNVGAWGRRPWIGYLG